MTGTGPTVAGGGLALSNAGGSGPATVLDGRELDNAAAAVWTGPGNIAVDSGGRFVNLTGATFEVRSDASLTGSGFPGSFANAGSFRKVDGSGMTALGIAFHNSGSVGVQTGMLDFGGGGDGTGAMSVSAGATLRFTYTPNTFTLRPSSVVDGDGTVQFAAQVVVTGAYAVANTVVTNGSVDFERDLNLTDLTLSGGTLTGLGDVTVTRMLNWTGGTMAGASRTRSTGVLIVNGAGIVGLDTRTLDNAGTAMWREGTIALSNGAVINNLPEATFDAQTDASLNGPFASPCAFHNGGTFRKSQGSGQTVVNIELDNNGLVDVQTGRLQLAGGASGGAFTAAAGTTLAFNSDHTLAAGSSVGGAGNVLFNRGTVSVFGAFAPGATTISGATVDFGSDVDLTALTFTDGTLTGSGDVTVEGQLTWTGGITSIMAGPGRTVSRGNLSLNPTFGSTAPFLDGRLLVNAGTAALTGVGSMSARNGAVIDNLAGATFLVQSDVSLDGPGAVFDNAGDFRKTAGSGSSQFNLAFRNSGSVEAETGTLNFNGGDSTGVMHVAARATLQFTANIFTLRASSATDGDGTVLLGPPAEGGHLIVAGSYAVANTLVNGATVDFDCAATVAHLTLSGGTLTGVGDLTVTGVLDWGSGTLSGTGHTLSTGALNLSGTGGKTLDTRTVDNAGTATWTGAGIAVNNGAVINNLPGGTFNAQAAASLVSLSGIPGMFHNGGTFRKAGGGGQTGVNVEFDNGGLVDVQNGTLQLTGGVSGGAFTAAAGTTLAFSGNHTLTPDSSVGGAGNVAFRAGAVGVFGTFAPGGATTISGGTVNFVRNVDLAALSFTDGTLSGNGDVTVEGPLAWSSGVMSGLGRTVARGSLSLNAPGFDDLLLQGRLLVNAGTATFTGGGMSVTGGAALDNLAGATFLIQGNAALHGSVAGFDNAGDFRAAAGSGTTTVQLAFNNSGTVEVESGTLSFNDGVSTGAMHVRSGATLLFTGSSPYSFTLGPSSVVDGDGTAQFGPLSSGVSYTLVAGSYAVANTLVGIGTVDFARDVTLAHLTLSGGTLTGVGDVTVTGALDWAGGTLSGTGHTLSTGALNFPFSYLTKTLDARTLDNAGTATWSPVIDGEGGLVLANGSVLTNLAGATFHIGGNASITGSLLNPGIFDNAGTLRATPSSANTTSIGVPFSNSGTVDVQSGTLSLTGAFANYSNSSHTLTGGTYLVRGTLKISDAAVTTNAATVVLDGPGSRIVDQSNRDALAVFTTNTDAGSFTIQNNRNFTLAGNFANAGAVTVGPGSTFSVTTPDGTYTQTGGTTLLSGGTLTAAGGVFIHAGSLAGTGTINGTVTNDGVVSPGGDGAAGVLTINGDYTQTATGVLTIDLGGTADGQYGRLAVTGIATLDGTLQVNLVGGFSPGAGDRFQVLTFGGRNGDFAAYALPDLGSSLYLDPAYDDTSLTLVTRTAP
jgi:hypothetical protein